MLISFPVEIINSIPIIGTSFGRVSEFYIYDTETHRSEVVKNSAEGASGGAGIKAAQQMIDLNIDVLITPQCGKNAMDIFQESKIKVYQSVGIHLQENLNLFAENRLNRLTENHSQPSK